MAAIGNAIHTVFAQIERVVPGGALPVVLLGVVVLLLAWNVAAPLSHPLDAPPGAGQPRRGNRPPPGGRPRAAYRHPPDEGGSDPCGRSNPSSATARSSPPSALRPRRGPARRPVVAVGGGRHRHRPRRLRQRRGAGTGAGRAARASMARCAAAASAAPAAVDSGVVDGSGYERRPGRRTRIPDVNLIIRTGTMTVEVPIDRPGPAPGPDRDRRTRRLHQRVRPGQRRRPDHRVRDLSLPERPLGGCPGGDPGDRDEGRERQDRLVRGHRPGPRPRTRGSPTSGRPSRRSRPSWPRRPRSRTSSRCRTS